MPEEEGPQTVAGRRGRQQHVPTILARRDREQVRDRTGRRDDTAAENAAVGLRTPSASPKSPKYSSQSLPVLMPSPEYLVTLSPRKLNADGKMDVEREVQAHIAWIKRYLEEARTYEDMKSEQLRRREAERVWREIEETENLRRKTKSYYHGDDPLPADDEGADGGDGKYLRPKRKSVKIRRLRLFDNVDDASESDDQHNAPKGVRDKDLVVRGKGRGVDTGLSKIEKPRTGVASEASADADSQEAARAGHGRPHGQQAGVRGGGELKTAVTKDEVARVLSQIRHRR